MQKLHGAVGEVIPAARKRRGVYTIDGQGRRWSIALMPDKGGMVRILHRIIPLLPNTLPRQRSTLKNTMSDTGDMEYSVALWDTHKAHTIDRHQVRDERTRSQFAARGNPCGSLETRSIHYRRTREEMKLHGASLLSEVINVALWDTHKLHGAIAR